MTTLKKKFNNLKNEKSPYLLQHAENPVNWNPWNDETFEMALKDDKPIFLSIGYSTCHWCHVMERESFEDEKVASLLNDNFINIKVDREERPDIDKIYMNVCQIMTGRGGWPLTIIMTPEKKPFFAATYIPKNSRYGTPGLIELVPNVVEIWENRRNEVNKSSEKITELLNGLNSHSNNYYIPDDLVTSTYDMFVKVFDDKNGGFGDKPKFPTPQNLFFLLRYWKKSGDNNALEMVKKTLKKMRYGGIFDHIGYGFHRYSVDEKWTVPHFEKMLYDQAMLSMAYLEAFQATKDKLFLETAEEIFTYVIREMLSEEGGFFSAQDADSEGVEGKLYLWEFDELKNNLSNESFEFLQQVFNLQKEGNFHEENSRKFTGNNILYYRDNLGSISNKLKISKHEIRNQLNNILSNLYLIRNRRVKPHLDDKILTDWNGLMSASFAIGARITGNNYYLEIAEKAIAFIKKNMIKNGRLFHCYRDGEAAVPGNLDDYSFLIWALIEIYQTSFKTEYLKLAIELSEVILKYFYDRKNGGFFFTPIDGENLISRSMDFYDGPIPSGNSITYYNFNRLFKITGNPEWMKYSESLLLRASSLMKQYPIGFSMLISAYMNEFFDSTNLIICNNSNDESLWDVVQKLYENYIPGISVISKQENHDNNEILELIPPLKNYETLNNKMTFYICKNGRCEKPLNDLNILLGEVNNYE